METKDKLFNRIPYTYIFRTVWILLIAGILSFIGSFVYIAKYKMPDTSELENPKFEESSIVYSEDLVELNRYFQRNRQWVKYEELNPHLIDALIATEDVRYHTHSGIDARGLARALVFLGQNGGASTITQQLAKQFFTEKPARFFPKRVWQKMKEWVIAVEFERRYTKEEILAMYFNKFDFRYQANGIGAASTIYFGKPQSELSVPEAATFVGMFKNPYIFNPVRKPENMLPKRNMVLRQMLKYKFITEEEYNIYKEAPLDVSKFSRGKNYNGLAPHFMAELKKEIKNIFESKGITKPGGAPFNLDVDGLEIYTTIDSRFQKHAEEASIKHMKDQQKKFEKVWNDRDPWDYIEKRSEKTEKEIERIRKSRDNILSGFVEASDRYQNMRFQALGPAIEKIKEKIPESRFYNGDIKRMIEAEKDGDYLASLLSTKTIRKDQKDVYQKVMQLEEWAQLKSAWRTFNKEVRAAFNKERSMQIYTHEGPKDVVMSPIDSIKHMANFLQLGSVSIDPKTGYIKAWVGGSNFKFWKYDHVRSSRQVGSTFKPFIYTAAMDNAISPCLRVRDMQYIIPANEPPFKLQDTWAPKNTRGEFTDEEISIKEALRKSLNSVSVYIVKELGSVRPIISIAESMGITEGKIPNYPSIALGSPSLSVYEMTKAYSTYANNGQSVKPIFIKKIVYQGTTIYEEQPRFRRALTEDVNYAMVDMLKNAVSPVQSQLKTTFGGKTGTTNDHIDGWFMGITPNLVTGTWVGGDQTWVRFTSLNEGQGGRMARPFFIDYMQRIEKDTSINFNTEASFHQPTDPGIIVDCSLYDKFYTQQDSVDLEPEFEDPDGY